MAYQVVRFSVSGSSLAIPVCNVREVVQMAKVAAVFYAPPYLLGLMNVRGDPLPVVDLGRLFGWPTEASARTLVVIVESGGLVGGFAASHPIDIVDLESDGGTVPSLDVQSHLEAVDRVVQIDGAPMMILHPERLFNLPPIRRLREGGFGLSRNQAV